MTDPNAAPHDEPRRHTERVGALFGVDAQRRHDVLAAMVRATHDRADRAGYWFQLALAMGIATLGLVLDSTGVVIGAMLVAPLMGPIVHLAMGLVIGSSVLALHALARVAMSVVAVVGRIVLLAGDPDLHRDGDTAVFYRNSVNWLKGVGRTADGGRTGLFISWGCTLCCSYVAGRGTPEVFTSVLGAGLTGNTTNWCGASLTSAAATHPVMSGFSTFWGCAMHGAFGSVPSGYVTLATSGGFASIVARESPVACVP